jgi:hypothetical protein
MIVDVQDTLTADRTPITNGSKLKNKPRLDIEYRENALRKLTAIPFMSTHLNSNFMHGRWCSISPRLDVPNCL